jgi:hypothetical protein
VVEPLLRRRYGDLSQAVGALVHPDCALAVREDFERFAFVIADGRCREGNGGIEDFGLGGSERSIVL